MLLGKLRVRGGLSMIYPLLPKEHENGEMGKNAKWMVFV